MTLPTSPKPAIIIAQVAGSSTSPAGRELAYTVDAGTATRAVASDDTAADATALLIDIGKRCQNRS